jgi:hypothetical protein
MHRCVLGVVWLKSNILQTFFFFEIRVKPRGLLPGQFKLGRRDYECGREQSVPGGIEPGPPLNEDPPTYPLRHAGLTFDKQSHIHAFVYKSFSGTALCNMPTLTSQP